MYYPNPNPTDTDFATNDRNVLIAGSELTLHLLIIPAQTHANPKSLQEITELRPLLAARGDMNGMTLMVGHDEHVHVPRTIVPLVNSSWTTFMHEDHTQEPIHNIAIPPSQSEVGTRLSAHRCRKLRCDAT